MRLSQNLPIRITLAGGACLIALWALYPASHAQMPQKELAPLNVRAEVPRADAGPGVAEQGASFAATIHYDREAQLAFRVPGRIASFPARIGDRMARGATLAMIDPAPYAAARQRAEANLDRTARAAKRYAALAQEGAAAGAQAQDGDDLTRAAQADLAAARYDLQSTRLTMPFAGAIIARRGEQGETVAAGQTILTVADTGSPMLASAQVPVAIAQSLNIGREARVILPDGQVLRARVLRKAAAANAGSGLVTIDLALPAAPHTGGRVISGSAASASFTASTPATPSAALRIPVEGLLEAQGSIAYVYVIDASGRARRQAVHLLGLADRDARITGLSPSARVITMGAGFVRDGQRVEVTR